jgi:tetratricopeptide (TPR) repeat protein
MLRQIKKSTIVTIFLFAMGSLGSCISHAQTPDETLWSNPEFLERFLGTYSPRITVEPRLGPEDKTFLEEEFLPVVLTDKPAAQAMLVAKANDPEANATYSMILANMYYQAGQLQQAVQSYEDAISKHKEFARAHENLGFLYFQLGNKEKTLEHFTTAVKLGAVDKNIYAILGYLFFEKEQFIAAETSYRSALIYEVENEDWEYGLAKSILFQRKFQDAAGLFDRLITGAPEQEEYWRLQADAYIGLNDTISAASNYEVLRRMKKITAENLITLGDIYVENGFIEASLSVYKEAIQQKGRLNVEKPIKAAATLIEAGFVDAASEVLAEIDKTYGSSLDSKLSFEVRKLKAKIQAESGQASASIIPILEEMASQNPLDGDVLILLADYYSSAGNFEKAEFLYERAQNIGRFEAKAFFHYGKALVAKKKYREALRALERAQEISPKDYVEEYLNGVRNVTRAVQN